MFQYADVKVQMYRRLNQKITTPTYVGPVYKLGIVPFDISKLTGYLL